MRHTDPNGVQEMEEPTDARETANMAQAGTMTESDAGERGARTAARKVKISIVTATVLTEVIGCADEAAAVMQIAGAPAGNDIRR